MVSGHKTSTSGPLNLHEIAELHRIDIEDGLVLRPLAEADATDILAILGKDPDIRQNVSVANKMNSPAGVSDTIKTAAEDGGLIRYVLDFDGKCIGMISFWRYDGFFGDDPRPNSYGFGYFLDNIYRGKGFITTSLLKLMQVARQNMYVEEFIAFCTDENPASSKILQTVGLKPTDNLVKEPNNGWLEREYSTKQPYEQNI